MAQAQAISINKDGNISVYVGGKRQWTGPVAELVAYLGSPEAPKVERRAKRQRPKSRSARWSDAAGAASTALSELQEIRQEFEEWKDNLPENLQGSALGEKLGAVCDLDIDSALETVQEAENADLPLGFGRD